MIQIQIQFYPTLFNFSRISWIYFNNCLYLIQTENLFLLVPNAIRKFVSNST